MTGSVVLAASMPGQVGGAAGARDDHPEPAARGRLGVAEQVVGRPMGRDDPQLATGRRARRARRTPARGSGSRSGCHRRCRRAAPCVAGSVGRRSASSPRRRRPHASRGARAVRAASSASSTSAPSAVTWPILRRSNTRRLSYRWRWTSGRRAPRRRRSSRAGRRGAGAQQVDHRGRGAARGRAQRQPADRPDVLLELARSRRPRSSSGRCCGRAARAR